MTKKKDGITPRASTHTTPLPRDISPRPTDEAKTEPQPTHFFATSPPEVSKGTTENESTSGGVEINSPIPSIPGVKEVYHVGLIDFLSRYYLAKKTAHLFKSVLWEDQMLSTVPPDFYANRFKEYLPTIFPTTGFSTASTPRGGEKPSGTSGSRKGIPKSLTDVELRQATTDLTSPPSSL